MRIGFVGLGTMGGRMVGHLATAGHQMWVRDVDDKAVEAATAVPNVEAWVDVDDQTDRVGPTLDVVILMLPNSDIVASVLGDVLDEDSLVRVLRPGARIVDMGSSRPAETRDWASAVEHLGLGFVDAPVSGGPVKAAAGDLTIMAGGTDADLDLVEPVLYRLGNVSRVGPVGAAHALKALNNLLSLTGLVGALEVLAAGVDFGLDPQIMLEVINRSTGRNHATEVKIGPNVIEGRYNVGFSLGLTYKDVRTALELADSQGLTLPLSSATVAICGEALEFLGVPHPDQSEIAKLIADRAGINFQP